jgi:hypothetical protein
MGLSAVFERKGPSLFVMFLRQSKHMNTATTANIKQNQNQNQNQVKAVGGNIVSFLLWQTSWPLIALALENEGNSHFGNTTTVT